VHDGYSVEMTKTGPVFRRADGSVVEARAQSP
jgi:hypothetical protein